MEKILIYVLSLLIVIIALLVALIVWRDRRELRVKQITKEIARIEEIYSEVNKINKELETALNNAQKRTDTAVSQIEEQIKQIKVLLASLERRPAPAASNEERPGAARERAPKQQGKGRQRSNSREFKQRDQSQSQSRTNPEQGEVVKINDGEKYGLIYEMAKKGLSTQEIARKFNLGHDEVRLVLDLKGKKLS